MSELPVKKWLQVSCNVDDSRVVEIRKMLSDKALHRMAIVFDKFTWPMKDEKEYNRFQAHANTMHKRLMDWLTTTDELTDGERHYLMVEFLQIINKALQKYNFRALMNEKDKLN